MKAPALQVPQPYPKQHEAIADPKRICVIEASTKSGKTAGCLVWILQQAWNGPRGYRLSLIHISEPTRPY